MNVKLRKETFFEVKIDTFQKLSMKKVKKIKNNLIVEVIQILSVEYQIIAIIA